MAKTKYLWLTNVYEKDAEERRKHINLPTIIGAPKSNQVFTIKQMREAGLVGIYKIV